MRNILKFFYIVAIAMVMAGCAGKNMHKAADLDERLHSYAMALDSNDLETLYAMTDPEYRKTNRLQDFIQRRNISYSGTAVQGVAIAEDGGSARVELSSTMKAMGFEFKNFKQKQEWILVDGNWYVVQKNTSLKGMMEN